MKIHNKIILGLFTLIFSLSGLLAPKPAHAQWVVTVAQDVTASLKWVWDKVEKTYDQVQGIVGAELANQTLEMYMNTMSYEVATQLTSGGPGGKPLFRVKSIQKTLQKSQEAAVGEFLAKLTKEGSWADLGINLCDPSLSFKLTATLALVDAEAPPKNTAGCNWRQVQNNWKRFDQSVQNDLIKIQLRKGSTSTDSFFDYLSNFSEVSDILKLSATLNNRKLEAVKTEELTASQCKGYIDKLANISDDVVTSCMEIMNMDTSQWIAAYQASADKIEERKIAATNRKLSDILKDAADNFSKTFTSKLINYWIKKGAISLLGGGGQDSPYDSYRDTLLDMLRGGSDLRQPNTGISKSFQQIKINQLESYDYLTTFATCPSDFRQPDHCTMSPNFLQAVNSHMTVGEAIDKGIINGALPFIGPNDPLNASEDKCYRDGLCYGNLVKLRKANITPVGWEMAAMRGPVTLKEAIDCFEDNGSCKFGVSMDYAVKGEPHNPFYHLVDGNWVLKAPEVLCDAYVYSSVLESSDSSNRQQYCADPQVCLREDEDGNCLEGQFSYCTRSENIWRFTGDICEDGELYSGCLNFNNKDIGSNSYIEDTLDYCTADQAGCRRYSQEKDNDGNWLFQDIAADNNDLFLNKNAQECSPDQAGCSEYIVIAADTGTNLFANGDFEIDSNNDLLPDGYEDFSATIPAFDPYLVLNEGVADSKAALSQVGVGNACRRINITPETLYTFSASFKQANTATISEILLQACSNASSQPGNISSPDGSFTVFNDLGGLPNKGYVRIDPVEYDNTSYTRVTGTINSGESVYCWVCAGGVGDFQYVDNLKMEVVSQPKAVSTYSNYGDGSTIYMNNSTVMCTSEEVGCQGYTPASGDPMVPAVITQNDLCPAECVGYSTFSQQPDNFDLMEDPGALVQYYNFIADTATACPAQDVGCEEFTNLDEVARGGEGREYYTYIRQCVPENLGTVYYTWEGSDVAGYQIKTWNILTSDASDAPCTNIDPGGSTCRDAAYEPALCGVETPLDITDDPDVEPNCRQFFGTAGDSYWRLQDKVIFASNNCHDYRRTLSATAGLTYKAIPDLGISCPASSNNCRSYYGNASNNIRVIASDNFENGTYSPWSAVAGGTLDLSNESLNNNGHSLKVTKIAAGTTIWRDLGDVLKDNKQYQMSWWMKNNGFINRLRVRLYMEDLSGAPVHTTAICDGLATDIEGVLLHDCDDTSLRDIEAGNWHYYSIAKLVDNLGPNINPNSLKLVFYINGNNGDVFFDNIILKEVTDSFSVIRNSWQTPASCDTPYTGYHLGCQAYTDTNNNSFNLRSFDHLCREEAIGCRPAINTRNSSNPFAETFNSGDYSEITVPADTLTYLVPDVNKYCASELKGCMALGATNRQDATKWETVYRINDPDRYNNILCDAAALGCEEYASDKGSYYFRDPGEQTCTYQENAQVGVNIISGWFRTSTLTADIPVGCSDDGDANPVEPSDVEFLRDYCHQVGLPGANLNFFTQTDCENNNGEWTDYNWAAVCPATKNLCTDFKDPSDPTGCDPKINDPNIAGYCSNSNLSTERDCNSGLCSNINYSTQATCVANGGTWALAGLWTPSCMNYYYYNNKAIDESSCNGQVDKNKGCALFYEANNWNGEHTQVLNTYDAVATYQENIDTNQAVSPVVCDPAVNPSCNLTASKLLKVNKDRQCAEWLACKSSSAVWDQASGEYKIVCDDLSSCVEYKYNSDSNTTKCKKWASYDTEVVPLTFANYQSRATGSYNHIQWSDKEYTGYAMPNYLPAKDLKVYNFGTNQDPQPRLVYDVSDSINLSNQRKYYADCVSGATNLDGQACTAQLGGEYFSGECKSGLCMVSPRAGDNSTSTFSIEARGYALADSPFPASIVSPSGERLSKYSKANMCEAGSEFPNGCEENYVKVTYGYGDKTMYYPDGVTLPPGICTGGGNLGQICTENKECDTLDNNGQPRQDGVCSLRKEEVKYRNWSGVCLEYDYDTEIIKDKTSAFYCNQWYPVDKVSGTSSLYDNYAEAGYYNVSGNDALFCSVAEAYTIPETRYYCGRSVEIDGLEYCTVLVKVPAGVKINASTMNNYGDTILRGYLSDNILTAHNPDDVVSDGGFSGSLGVYWLKRNNAEALFSGEPQAVYPDELPLSAGAKQDSGSSLFFVTDFNGSGQLNLNQTSHLPALAVEDLSKIFDASDATGAVEMYFYDSKVNSNGYPHWAAAVLNPFSSDPNAWLPSGSYHIYSHRGDGDCDDGVECNQCALGWHESWWNSHLDGVPTSGDRRGWDGDGNMEIDRWCSPLSHGIYVIPSSPSTATVVNICEETDCSAADKGIDCLRSSAPYASIVVPVDGCAGDPNCEYKQCVESIGVTSNQWCSDWGEYSVGMITIAYNCPSSGVHEVSYQDVTSISPCLDKIYTTTMTFIPSSVLYGGETCTANINQTYRQLTVKSGVDQNLVTQIFNPTATVTGCMDSTIGADCALRTIDAGTGWYDLSSWNTAGRTGWLTGLRYTPSSMGTDCTNLGCYQECGRITQLDSEGDLSWVRTDIWWREETSGVRLIVPRWTSWYYDKANAYNLHDDVTYDDIISESFKLPSHYGAALGLIGDQVVTTKVPLSAGGASSLSAATFFGFDNTASTTEEIWSYATSKLTNIFAHTYNLDWDDTTQSYRPVTAGGVDIDGLGNNRNTFAGRDYRPRILAVCAGDKLCEIRDASGNLTGVQAGITVNATTSGNLIGQDGALFVNAKFFYHAHPDHMPVYSIDVDWGDSTIGNYSTNPGKYKNSIFDCNPDSDMPGLTNAKQGFGGLDRACREGYKVFYHDYQFDLDKAGVSHPCNGIGGRPIDANASCYQPTIRVIDRWGWVSEARFNGWIMIYK